jgi:MoaA/NifB/PqqE/SkfB family radical SAM enzyme
MGDDTFCILPWLQLNFSTDGSAQLCCRATRSIADGKGVPLTLDRAPFSQIWNSEHMVNARRAMAEGRRVADCAPCYLHERTMGTSLRKDANDGWLWSVPVEERPAVIRKRIAQSVADGHVMKTAPIKLHLWFGSHCNLQCRMCHATFSSRIAADPVHRSWSPGAPTAGLPPEQRRFQDGRNWAESRSVVFGELFEDTSQITSLAFAGGEPFLQAQIEPLLQLLIDRGRAPLMDLYFSTNGTVYRESLIDKLKQFGKVTLAVSVDGVGAVNDYIRFPSRWDAVWQNVLRFRDLGFALVQVDPTFQAYNALAITDLLRLCDREGLECLLGNLLLYPDHLSVRVLPASCRRVARERLEAYLADCPERHRPGATTLARSLAGPEDRQQAGLLSTFMTFTNDLDASRKQSLAAAIPELVEGLASAGFPWKATRRFVPVAALGSQVQAGG